MLLFTTLFYCFYVNTFIFFFFKYPCSGVNRELVSDPSITWGSENGGEGGVFWYMDGALTSTDFHLVSLVPWLNRSVAKSSTEFPTKLGHILETLKPRLPVLPAWCWYSETPGLSGEGGQSEKQEGGGEAGEEEQVLLGDHEGHRARRVGLVIPICLALL